MTIASGQTGSVEKKKRSGGSSPGAEDKHVCTNWLFHFFQRLLSTHSWIRLSRFFFQKKLGAHSGMGFREPQHAARDRCTGRLWPGLLLFGVLQDGRWRSVRWVPLYHFFLSRWCFGIWNIYLVFPVLSSFYLSFLLLLFWFFSHDWFRCIDWLLDWIYTQSARWLIEWFIYWSIDWLIDGMHILTLAFCALL